jgi:polysaccharide biosynthesis protein PslH
MVDVDSQKWFDYAERAGGPKAALYRLEGRRVRTLERTAARARSVTFATEAEAGLYRGYCPEARVEAIMNGVDLDYFRPPSDVEESGKLVFVGQLDYRANVLGLNWFCREAWPAIRDRLPEASFQIVGRDPVAAVRRLGTMPGIEVVGAVPDVRPYLASARVVVVPLPVARGVQNKVLEAMAMGRPVVGSAAALEGIPLLEGRDALAATAPPDWVRCIAGLWDDPARRGELGRNARRYVEANHRWEACLGRFDELVAAPVEATVQRGA